MNIKKYFYIKVEMYVELQGFMPFGYFEELIITDYLNHKPEINISTISEKQYAKKYKRKAWANKMIKKIYELTKDNTLLFRDDGTYIYKFEIVEE